MLANLLRTVGMESHDHFLQRVVEQSVVCLVDVTGQQTLEEHQPCRRGNGGRRRSLRVACCRLDVRRRLSPSLACRRGSAGRRLRLRVTRRLDVLVLQMLEQLMDVPKIVLQDRGQR